jgi:hypothetical protein
LHTCTPAHTRMVARLKRALDPMRILDRGKAFDVEGAAT